VKKILLTIIKYVLAFGIAILLLWWSFHGLSDKDLDDIGSAIREANYSMILPVFGILLLSHLFRALRWRELIIPLGYKPKAYHLLLGILVGYIANQLIPRAGEIVRCTSVAKQTKTPAEKLIGTIVAERAFDVVCLLIITIATVYIEYDYIQPYAHEIYTSVIHGLKTGTGKYWTIGILIVLALVIFWLYRRFKSHKMTNVFSKIAKGLWLGLSSITKVQNKFLFLLYTVGMWACYIASTWIGCLALKETAHLGWDTGLAMLVFGTFGIIVAPGGLGAYPIAIQKTLTLYGLPDTIGLASGWLLWLAQFVFNLIFGTAAYFILRYIKAKHEKRNRDTIENIQPTGPA
jgi:glycosyltransferase 2 family protein